jgi:hypothetical protein
MALKITKIHCDVEVWKHAEAFTPLTVLHMQHTDRLFLRVYDGLVSLNDGVGRRYDLTGSCDKQGLGRALFREVKAELTVEL